MSDDNRVSFFVKSICGLLDISDDRKIYPTVENSREVRDFLDDPNEVSMKIIVFKGGNLEITLKLASAISYEEEVISEIVFVKRSLSSITPDNILKCIEVHCIQSGSPIDSLYNSLKGIWGPSLLQNRSMADKLPLRVTQLLTELQSSLSGSLTNKSNQSSGFDVDNYSDIVEPIDEIQVEKEYQDTDIYLYACVLRIFLNAFSRLNLFFCFC